MKKDIYVIKNSINDKVYVGQSVDAARRWWQHTSDARHNKGCFIDKEMGRLGYENFHYEILEHDVENYDERERYWVEKLNSRVPNGYNVFRGGATDAGIDHISANFKTEDDIDTVRLLLKETDLTMTEIAKNLKVSVSCIVDINNGRSYHKEGVEYPVRPLRTMSDDTFKRIVYSLKYEHDKSMRVISREYDVDLSVINEINSGTLHRKDWLQYPLRKGHVFNPLIHHYLEIIDLLKNTDMQQKDIAKMFNIGCASVSNINLGRIYRQDGQKYPIRESYQYNRRKSFSPDEVREIEKLLKDGDLSLRDIAKRFEAGYSTIFDINNGQKKAYFNPNIEYPIRKLKS